MTELPLDDLFERYESLYARTVDGQLIQLAKPTLADLERTYSITIDGQKVTVNRAVPSTDEQGNVLRDDQNDVIPRQTTIYDAANLRYQGQPNPIPILCHQNHMKPVGVCRVCCVMTGNEYRSGQKMIPACQHPVNQDNMVIHTVESRERVKVLGQECVAGEFVKDQARGLVELLAANHLHSIQVPSQKKFENELLTVAQRLKRREGQGSIPRLPLLLQRKPHDEERVDQSSEVIAYDANSCILCDRCVRGCSEVKPFKVIGHTGFGNKARISFDLGAPMGQSSCVSCGECAISCPTGALTFKTSVYQAPDRTGKARDPWVEERRSFWMQLGKEPDLQIVPADELAAIPLFRGVPYAFLKWNEGGVGRLRLADREVELCRQDTYGSTAFIIEEGEIQVRRDRQVLAQRRRSDVLLGPRPGAAARRVAEQDPNDGLVGELACLGHQPRSASLVARPGSSVLILKRNLLYMLQRNREARRILFPLYQRRALLVFREKGELFKGLPEDLGQACIDFLFQEQGQWEELPDAPDRPPRPVQFLQINPGQKVIRQDTRAEYFYIIHRGHVSVEGIDQQGRSLIRDYMGPLRHFGEIGLLSDPAVGGAETARMLAEVMGGPVRAGRRTGTCTALDHVELVRIHKDTFRGLLKAHPPLLAHLRDWAVQRLRKNRQTREQIGLQVEPFTEPGLYQGQKLMVLDLERCTRCQECVKACAETHDGVTRLVLEGNRFGKFLVPSACRSCHDPLCLNGCPVDAIHRKTGKHTLAIVIEDHCIGCGLCAHNCPYGSIHMDSRHARRAGQSERIATNCDLCESLDGNPRCVHRCPHDAAIRIAGYDLARRVGLQPEGSAADEQRWQEQHTG
jgi:Fe-S-cluster-containing hydrogenase component 2/CRP-like cAMP-binding protein